MLSDGDLEKTTEMPNPEVGEKSWIQYEFPSRRTIRAITIGSKDPGWIARARARRPGEGA